MAEVFLDSLIDTLKVFPFLLVVYVLIELIEVKGIKKIKANKMLKGCLAPLVGAGVGIVPQCGFSVMATNLFSKRLITIGTLLAVYIATSDEAVPILMANWESWDLLWPVLLIKLVLAITVGCAVDLVLRLKDKNKIVKVEAEPEKTLENGEATDCEYIDDDGEKGCCGHDLEAESNLKTFFIHPLIHSLKILLFIFVINLVLGLIIFAVGEQSLNQFLLSSKAFQPFIAALIGLIPNCASSVVITQLYILGGLSLGSAVAGLTVNAGIAFAVLFKQNKNLKQNLLIVGGLYLLSSVVGMIIALIMR